MFTSGLVGHANTVFCPSRSFPTLGRDQMGMSTGPEAVVDAHEATEPELAARLTSMVSR